MSAYGRKESVLGRIKWAAVWGGGRMVANSWPLTPPELCSTPWPKHLCHVSKLPAAVAPELKAGSHALQALLQALPLKSLFMASGPDSQSPAQKDVLVHLKS